MFVSEDNLRPKFLKPFFINDLAIATNAHALIFFDKTLCEEKLTPYIDKPESILSVIPNERNENFSIPIETIKAAIAKCPLIDEIKEEKITCDACDGEGTVEYEFDYGYKSYELEGDCPVCNGEGSTGKDIPTGNRVVDMFTPIKIKNSCFSAFYLNKLVQVAKILNKDSIVLTLMTGKNNTTIFKIDNVEIILMPLMFEGVKKDMIELCHLKN